MRRAVFSVLLAIVACVASVQNPNAKECNRDIGPEVFCGTYRGGPKTTFVKKADGTIAPLQRFESLYDLLTQFVPDDEKMRDWYDWGLASAPNERVPEERHNVELEGYIVAVKPCEDDRDYHVIVTDSGKREFMNVEVSGLPVNRVDEVHFKRVRGEIEAVLAAAGVSSACGNYHKPNKPIHVLIRGSLYFDGDHRAGCPNCPGPSFAKPSTVWEIHPVYSITPIE